MNKNNDELKSKLFDNMKSLAADDSIDSASFLASIASLVESEEYNDIADELVGDEKLDDDHFADDMTEIKLDSSFSHYRADEKIDEDFLVDMDDIFDDDFKKSANTKSKKDEDLHGHNRSSHASSGLRKPEVVEDTIEDFVVADIADYLDDSVKKGSAPNKKELVETEEQIELLRNFDDDLSELEEKADEYLERLELEAKEKAEREAREKAEAIARAKAIKEEKARAEKEAKEARARAVKEAKEARARAIKEAKAAKTHVVKEEPIEAQVDEETEVDVSDELDLASVLSAEVMEVEAEIEGIDAEASAEACLSVENDSEDATEAATDGEKTDENAESDENSTAGDAEENSDSEAAIENNDLAEEEKEEVLDEAALKLKKRKNLINNLVRIACLLIFVYCVGRIGLYYYQSYKWKQSNKKLADIVGDISKDVVVEPQEVIEIHFPDELIYASNAGSFKNEVSDDWASKYQSLVEMNSDCVGWLQIPDTNINYPVMYTPDNPEKYLYKNFEGEYLYRGLPFMAEGTLLNVSQNYILYGHHMADGTAFNNICKYLDSKFLKEHPYAYFNTAYSEGVYEVMAVVITKVFNVEDECFKYYKYSGNLTEDEFNTYVYYMKRMSSYNTGVDAVYGDQLLSLSTCYRVYDPDGRLVVVFKRVK